MSNIEAPPPPYTSAFSATSMFSANAWRRSSPTKSEEHAYEQFEMKQRYRLIHYVFAWVYFVAAVACVSTLVSTESGLEGQMFVSWQDIDGLQVLKDVPQEAIAPLTMRKKLDTVKAQWFVPPAFLISCLAHAFIATSSYPHLTAHSVGVIDDAVTSSLLMFAACILYGIWDVGHVVCLCVMQAVATFLLGMPSSPRRITTSMAGTAYSAALFVGMWVGIAFITVEYISESKIWLFAIMATHAFLLLCSLVLGILSAAKQFSVHTADILHIVVSFAGKHHILVAVLAAVKTNQSNLHNTFLYSASSTAGVVFILSLITSLIAHKYPVPKS